METPTCSVCRVQFDGPTPFEAEAALWAHVRDVHEPHMDTDLDPDAVADRSHKPGRHRAG